MRLPSGLNATLDTVPVWPVSGVADRLAGGRVPHPHRLVVAAGDDPRAVGAERHTAHRVGVAGDRAGRRVGRWPRPTPAPSCRRLPETIRLPSGLNATLHTVSVWPVSGGPIGWPVAASHTRTVLSKLPETIRCPSGLNATLSTPSVWPVSGVADRVGRWPRPTPAPSCRRLPETIRSPSGLNATLHTASVWPVSGWPTGWPVAASHTRTVVSRLPETIRSPSGLNATVFTSDGSSTILIRCDHLGQQH